MQEILKVQNLTKSYHGKKVVDQLNLSLKKGMVYGLLGANGAGKSTTVECILGTRRPDCGEITILGVHPGENRKIFEKIGVQFQESNYPREIKVAEICEETSSLYNSPDSWKELLEKFGLKQKEKAYVKDLSGGERQRLFIVLALIGQPELIFLDELTTGLDTKARRETWQMLLALKEKGISMILTSHFMDEVEALCDQIMILRKGNAVFQGSIGDAVLASPYNNLEDAYLWYSEEGKDENILDHA